MRSSRKPTFDLFFAYFDFFRGVLGLLGGRHLTTYNLWFAEPMVCMQVAFHENAENHKDNSDSYEQGVECWISGKHGNHGNDKKPREFKVQTTGSPNNGFRDSRLFESNKLGGNFDPP